MRLLSKENKHGSRAASCKYNGTPKRPSNGSSLPASDVEGCYLLLFFIYSSKSYNLLFRRSVFPEGYANVCIKGHTHTRSTEHKPGITMEASHQKKKTTKKSYRIGVSFFICSIQRTLIRIPTLERVLLDTTTNGPFSIDPVLDWLNV